MRYDTTNNFSLFNLLTFFIVINQQIENAGDFFAIEVSILYLNIHEPFAINLIYLIKCGHTGLTVILVLENFIFHSNTAGNKTVPNINETFTSTP